MIKMFWTAALIAVVFTFLAISISVIRALLSFEISDETEERMLKIFAYNALIAGACWCISFVLGMIVLFVRIWT